MERRGAVGAGRRRTSRLGTVADAPIGIFDSGYGGLTVARAVLDQLPHESVAYLGDTARQPYGPRPIAEVRAFALECMDRLVDRDVKALVIACNSASAAMLHDARERYDVPVVEVIRPAVRRAVAATRNNQVGVISTQATHQSHAYADSFAAAPQITVTSRPCPRFVEFVESGVTGGPGAAQRCPRVPRPDRRAGRRHADPGLHPLPAADRCHLLRHGRGRHAGVLGRGDRQGRLPRARRRRRAAPGRPAAADPRVRHDGRPGRVRAAGTPVPRARGGAAPRPRPWPADEADRRRVLRLAAGPVARRPPATWWRPSTRAAPGAWSSTSATGRWGRCSGTSTSARSTPSSSATCTRTTAWTCAACTSPSGTTRAAPTPGRSRSTARRGSRERMARAYDLDDPDGMARRAGLPRADRPGRVRGRAVHGHAVPGQPPGRGLRRAGRGRTAARWPTPVTPTRCPALAPLCHDAYAGPRATPPSSTAATPPSGIHLSGQPRRRARRSRPGACSG